MDHEPPKNPLSRILVHLASLLVDWIDNLGNNISNNEKFVKKRKKRSVDLPRVEPGRLGLSIQSS